MFGGWYLACLWLLGALVAAVSIVGLPISRAALEMAKMSAFPFGKDVVHVRELDGKGLTAVTALTGTVGFIVNIIWACTFGIVELKGNVRIFDARTPSEFSGTDLRNNARGGHLPSARLLPRANLLDNSLVRPASALRQMLSDVGFQPGDHIVTHCDGGGRAALAAIAAVRAGYTDVRAYYLSFSNWAKDESCAIVKEESRSIAHHTPGSGAESQSN